MHPIQSAQHSTDHRAVAESVTMRSHGEPGTRVLEAASLTVATLFADPTRDDIALAVRQFLASAGAALDLHALPSSLARGGTVGRIGIPHDAAVIVEQQRAVIGASFGADPLAPVPRLWRGLQRRADVLIDMRRSLTLPGSDAKRAGNERDVLLVSQRILERTLRQARSDAPTADEWTRARESAEIVYRLAAAEQRTVMLVLPIGRGTGAQQSFADALERQARVHRQPAPRIVKAGLLSALLSGDSASARWLAASVMQMDELSALATEAIGDTGPWPVVSVGRGATFYDMPMAASDAHDPVPLLLVIVHMLQRCGRAAGARALMDSLLVTRTAEERMREELGSQLPVPTDAFLRGVLANWGRTPSGAALVDRALTERALVDIARTPIGLIGEPLRNSSLDAWNADRPERRSRSRSALSA
ncbi:MAG: hypothetical protein H7099_11320 [Gemmatimonadaceae bacterium]|nr:hypothetical protein [Gemmatimonadaceae bacterium]